MNNILLKGKEIHMNELDIIKHARGYLDLISKGYNPITKEKYSENSDFNNERLIKCFSFVTEILDRVIIAETQKNTDATKETNKYSIKSENIKPEESYNEELLYNPSALVSDDVDGADVVKTLIEKGLLKQGITNNPKHNNS
jgi:hypothetical protein